MHITRGRIIIILVLFTVYLCYQLLFGSLLPVSPLVSGFNRYELPNSVVFIQEGADFNNFTALDTLNSGVEHFHRLEFTGKPRFFVFRDSLEYIKRSGSGARFCTYSTGRIVISPWALQEAEEGKISLEIYLRHELSHLLIFQHKGLLASRKYPGWLLEGIAMYSSEQMGTSIYPGKEETYRIISRGNFFPPDYYKTRSGKRIRLDINNRIAFIYSEFACIVDYLIESWGKEKFITYMKGLLADNNHEKVFISVYGYGFELFLEDFKRHAYEMNTLEQI